MKKAVVLLAGMMLMGLTAVAETTPAAVAAAPEKALTGSVPAYFQMVTSDLDGAETQLGLKVDGANVMYSLGGGLAVGADLDVDMIFANAGFWEDVTEFGFKLSPKVEKQLNPALKLGAALEFGMASVKNDGDKDDEASGTMFGVKPYASYTAGKVTVDAELEYTSFTADADGAEAATELRIEPDVTYALSDKVNLGAEFEFVHEGYDGEAVGNTLRVAPFAEYVAMEGLTLGAMVGIYSISPEEGDSTSGTLIKPYAEYVKALTPALDLTAEAKYEMFSEDIGDCSNLTLQAGVTYKF